MTVDYPDWGTSQDAANKIAATGVGLLRFSNVLASGIGSVLNGGQSTKPVNLAAFGQPSWELAINANLPAASGTEPFVLLLFDWRDPTGNVVVARDALICAAGNGAANLVITGGDGPAKSEVLTFQIFNLDTVQQLTYSFTLAQTSHVFEQTRWRQPILPATAPNGFTYPGADPRRGIVANANPTVVPGTPSDFLLPAYSGKIRGMLDNTNQANSCTLFFRDIYGLGLTVPTVLDRIDAAAGAVTRFETTAPFEPMIARVVNNGGAGNIAPTFTLVAEDY